MSRRASIAAFPNRALPRLTWERPPVLAVIGAAVALAWLFVAIFAPLLGLHDPLGQNFDSFSSPSGAHPFGTDGVGRDVLSRVVYGARTTIPLSLLLVLMALLVGGLIGGVSGYFGGPIDEIAMRGTDLVFAFPPIILAMAIAAALGPDLWHAVLAMLVVSWPTYARVTRGLVLSARQADYVSAARLLGASTPRVLTREVLPNLAGPVLVLATLDIGTAILLLSGLSFLGLGARPPAPEWGSMVASGVQNFDKWWIALFPGLAILTVVFAFNLLGDALRDRLDPRVSRRLKEFSV